MDVMKVFIGWSGETSKEIASILKNWLNGMFDGHVSAFTPDDLAPGSLWFGALPRAITDADCGLLCVTADNVNSQWLSYEAGALSGNVKLLIPILFGVSSLRVGAPLRMFQPISFKADGMRELTQTLNELLGEALIPPQELDRRFKARYPALEMMIDESLSSERKQALSAPNDEDIENWTKNDWLQAISSLEKRLNFLAEKLSRSSADFSVSPSHDTRPNREISL